jgi:hypothetical protein
MPSQIASTVVLARAILFDLDRTKEKQAIPTQTLELLLRTLIEVADRDNPTARKIEAASATFVSSRITGLEGQ